METLIIVALTTIALLAALGAGVFLGQLRAQFTQLRRDNSDLQQSISDLQKRAEDAQYPRRLTHALNARLEDLLAIAHDLRAEIELTGLHLDQEHRDDRDRLHQLEALAASISESLAKARNASPTAHPDDDPDRTFFPKKEL